MEKQQVSFEVPFEEKISRLFIFRMFWMFVLVWPFFLIGAWLYIVMLLHFVYMLILGKRQKYLWSQFVRAYTWMIKWQSYFGTMVDSRPKFWW